MLQLNPRAHAMSPSAAYQTNKSAAAAAFQLPEQAEKVDVQYNGGNPAGFGEQHSATGAEPPLPDGKQGCQHADSLAPKSGSAFARYSRNYEVPSAQLHSYLLKPSHASHLQHCQIQQDCLVPASVGALQHCGISQQQGNCRLPSGATTLHSRVSPPPTVPSAHSAQSHVMAANVRQQLHRPNRAVAPSDEGPQDPSQRTSSETLVPPLPGRAMAITAPDRATVPQPKPDVTSSFLNVPARPAAAAAQQAAPDSVVHESGTSAASVFSLAPGSVAHGTTALMRAPSSRPESVSESDGATRLASLPAPPLPPLPGRGGKTGRAPRSAAKVRTSHLRWVFASSCHRSVAHSWSKSQISFRFTADKIAFAREHMPMETILPSWPTVFIGHGTSSVAVPAHCAGVLQTGMNFSRVHLMSQGWTAFTSFGLHARNTVRAENPGVAPAQVEKVGTRCQVKSPVL